MSREKAGIEKRKEKIDELLQTDTEFLTDAEKTTTSIKIQTQLKSLGQSVQSFKKHTEDIIRICAGGEVEKFQDDQEDVADLANEITAKYEAMENRSRKIERASSSALGITLEKYHPTGTDKFLKYNSFMDTFTETVKKKDIKDFVKLEILKKSLGGEAYEAIQPYTNGAQLNEAIKILQDRYAKPRFVIAEIYKNLKDMPKITSFTTSMKVAKDQVRLLKISVATLKSLGYEKELISETTFQNTFILVELERKIPLEGYNKWVDRKASLNAKGKEPNLQDFVNCYEQQVISISDA